MKKKWALGMVVIFGLVLAGCSTSKEKEETPEKESAGSDTFVYGISSDPTALNPIVVGDRWGLTVTNMVYSPLVRIEADGSQKSELAESIEVAPDGLSLSVKLKEGVTWSDGEKFTADDVIFTYEEKAKKENGNFDNLWLDDKPITLEKVDEQTVKFILPSVSAAAINNITTEVYIIPQHIFKDVTDFSVNELKPAAVGTGPYKLMTYKRGEYLQFEANDTYYGGKPAVKNVTLRIVGSADTTKVALQKGEIDASFVLPTDIEELDAKKLTMYEYSENRVGYLGLNSNSDSLQELKVRQAIMYALNREDLNKAAYLSDKYFTNAYSILPPNNPFYTDTVEKYDVDVAKAKDLLKEAGVTELKLNLGFTSDDPVQTIQATLIQQQLQEVGITVELAGGDGSALFAEQKKADTKKYDLFIGGYIMGNDPDFYSALYASDGSANYTHYKSEKTDKLFNEGAVELDEAKRKEIYVALQEQIAADATIYPIVDSKKVLAVNSAVKNIEAAGLVPIYTFEDLSKITRK